MADNSSSHQATRYDLEIAATLPYIDLFYQATMDVIRAVGGPVAQWLDTGCGAAAVSGGVRDSVSARSACGPWQPLLGCTRAFS